MNCRNLALLLLGPLTLASTLASPTLAQEEEVLVVLNKSAANVSLIDPQGGETKATLPVGEGPHEAATAPDGKTVVVGNYGQQKPGQTLTVLDVETREVVRTIDLEEYHRPHGIVFLPGGEKVLVTAEAEKKLLVVDIGSGEVEAAIDTDQAVSHMVVYDPERQFAFVANIGSGSISVIDVAKKELLKVISTGAGAEGIALRPGKAEVWVSNREADTVSVVAADSLEVKATIEVGRFPIRVAFTPDGKHALVSCAVASRLDVIDTASQAVVHEIPMKAKAAAAAAEDDARLFADQKGPVPVGILVHPSGKKAYVANTQADQLSVIDLEKWEVAGRIETGKEPDGMTWAKVEKR